jgi:hypothetical protein
MMIQLIPVLPAAKTCEWCFHQQCYIASLWYGDVLLTFYSKDAARLEPDALNATACEILQKLTQALRPGQETVIESGDLWTAIGNAGCLPCYWADYAPPVLIAHSSSVRIPTEPAPNSEAQP